jgi:hypothetical protein
MGRVRVWAKDMADVEYELWLADLDRSTDRQTINQMALSAIAAMRLPSLRAWRWDWAN